MDLALNVDATGALLLLRNSERKIAYARVNALNATARDVQRALRERAAAVLTLRGKREFILRQVAVWKPRASVAAGRYETRIAVGQRRGLLLTMLETGGTRSSSRYPETVVPIVGGARPSAQQDVPKEYFTRRLQLHATAAGVLEGRGGIFGIPHVGIFERTGPDSDRMLYRYVAQVRVPPALHWMAVASTVAMLRFPIHLAAQVVDAMRHELTHLVEEAFA